MNLDPKVGCLFSRPRTHPRQRVNAKSPHGHRTNLHTVSHGFINSTRAMPVEHSARNSQHWGENSMITEQNANHIYSQSMHAKVYDPRRIILANQPRLLREMLSRVFAATPGLQVVGEVENFVGLAELMTQVKAHWLIVTLDGEGQSPLRVSNPGTGLPTTSLMAISADGRQVEVQTAMADGGVHQYILYDVSLAVLLAILS